MSTNTGVYFESIWVSPDYTEASIIVRIKDKGKSNIYNLTVTLDEKEIRKQCDLEEGTPLKEGIKRIIEKINPNAIIHFTTKEPSTKSKKEHNISEQEQKESVDLILNQWLGKEGESSKDFNQELGIMGMHIQRIEAAVGEAQKTATISTSLHNAQIKYLQKLQKKIVQLERSFKGLTLDARSKGAEEFTTLRKELAMNVFRNFVCPQIKTILSNHGHKEEIDKILCIYGFNRLFTRDRASAGTDIDFMLVLDIDDKEVIEEVRKMIKNVVKPELNKIGIDMETSDYLIIDLGTYQKKLDDIHSSLFTLANMFNPIKTKDNTAFITGSPSIYEKIFTFSNEQLAKHYVTLLVKNGFLKPEDREPYQKNLLEKLNVQGKEFRNHIIDHLQKMANSELYIGKEPYKKKQTIQTILAAYPPDNIKRKNRAIPFSIKFCINRIADLIHSTTIKPPMSENQFHNLETLGLFLCNIVCYQEAQEQAPVKVLEKYSDITLDQMKQIDIKDRILISYFLKSFDIDVPPYGDAEKLYDGLWSLADKLCKIAQSLEQTISEEATKFAFVA